MSGAATVGPLLALEAAGLACSAAVWRPGEGVVAERLERRARGQSERLLPLAEAVMAEAGLAYRELAALAVTLGPGGFTGVRIGLAAVAGLALAWNLPVLGFDTFAVVAAALPPDLAPGRDRLILIDAKRPEVYAQRQAAGQPPDPPALLAPATLAAALPPERPLLLAGDGVAQARPALEAAGLALTVAPGEGQAEARHLALLAGAALRAGRLPPPGVLPQPLYLRAPDTTLPKRAPVSAI